MSEKIGPRHLARKAILYVRQSSPEQVVHHVESQRLQYAMVSRLRERGWSEVEVIDEDLGRSASGTRVRPGFDGMVAPTVPRHRIGSAMPCSRRRRKAWRAEPSSRNVLNTSAIACCTRG
jgi:hypothetical protein